MFDRSKGMTKGEMRVFSSGKGRSGFEPINHLTKRCTDPEHTPPSHMVIPQGMRYRHVCPSCGETQYIYPVETTL